MQSEVLFSVFSVTSVVKSNGSSGIYSDATFASFGLFAFLT
jgi:hypothetical protein